MAKYRQVHCSFWNGDADMTDSFTPEDRYFYLYLLTNPHAKQCGIYELSMKYMTMETGWSAKKLRAMLEKFENEHKKIKYNTYTKEIAIKNWPKYNVSASPKVQACVEAELVTVKDRELVKWLGYSIDTIYQDYTNKDKEKNKNKNKYVEQGYSILKYLNEKAFRQFEKVHKYTLARLKEHPPGDLRLVVDFKVGEWLCDDKMARYLRQETLFAPSHFDTYLAEAKESGKKHNIKYPICEGCGKTLKNETDNGIKTCYRCGRAI